MNGYYNDYTDYTFENPTGQFIPAEDGEEFQLFEYLQGDAKFYGFEAEVGFPLWQQGEDHLELRLASDYVRGKLDNGGDLPNIPPLRVGAGLHYDLGQWHLGTQVFYYDKQDKIAANELLTDGYTMVNADTSYRFTMAKSTVFLFLKGTNLLDEDARQHSSPLKDIAPLPGPSFHVGVRAEF